MLTSILSAILWLIGAVVSAFLLILGLSYVFRKLAETLEWLVSKASDPFGMKERRERRLHEKEEAERKRRDEDKAWQHKQRQEQHQQQHQANRDKNGGHTHKEQQHQAEQVKAEIKQKSFMDGWREVVNKWELELDQDLYTVEELLERQAERYDRLQAKYAKVKYD